MKSIPELRDETTTDAAALIQICKQLEEMETRLRWTVERESLNAPGSNPAGPNASIVHVFSRPLSRCGLADQLEAWIDLESKFVAEALAPKVGEGTIRWLEHPRLKRALTEDGLVMSIYARFEWS